MSEEYYISWDEIYKRVNRLDKTKTYWGIPRGGTIIAGLTGKAVNTLEEADVILDDLIDSGTTYERYKKLYPEKNFLVLFNKQLEKDLQNKWLVFPWESQDESKEIDDNIIRILEYHNAPLLWKESLEHYIKIYFELEYPEMKVKKREWD